MGVELLIRLRRLDEVCPFHSGTAQDCIFVSPSTRRLLFSNSILESRSAVTPYFFRFDLKSRLNRVRSRGLTGTARGSSFSNGFGPDWNAKGPADSTLYNAESDQIIERIAADLSVESGFWNSGAGLSFIRRGVRNTRKRPHGTSNRWDSDFGEEDSLVLRDLSTSADALIGSSEKASLAGLSSLSREHPLTGGGAKVGADIPLSLKMLKRRQRRGKLATGLAGVGNSLQEAFSSMVFMLRTLQSHTLDIRRQLFIGEVESLLNIAQREMHTSFLWLFQQIFSCTPELMILVMILLVNFTVYSVGNSPAFSPPMSSLEVFSFLTKTSGLTEFVETASPTNTSDDKLVVHLEKTVWSSPPVNDGAAHHNDNGRAGHGGGRSFRVAGGEDGDSHVRRGSESGAMYSHKDAIPSEVSSIAACAYGESGYYQSEPQPSTCGDLSNSTMLDDNGRVQKGFRKLGHSDSVILDQETVHNIVAPVNARLEGDDYSCYDRTDLAYQQAIIDDKLNPLLLANYAQFLFLVRHDHDRAEELFRRAVVADPCNSDAIGCFASFLWLARHNLVAAEKAYQAALSVDPSSPFHAANYAHFLWHSGQ